MPKSIIKFVPLLKQLVIFMQVNVPSLETLNVSGIYNIENIWSSMKHESAAINLSKLKSLKLSSLNKLRSLFSGCDIQLQILRVSNCLTFILDDKVFKLYYIYLVIIKF